MYFTMWYGVFDPATRTLEFASAGHHPAYVVSADRSGTVPLRTRNPMIGAMPGIAYKADRASLPPAATLYVFSDGVTGAARADGMDDDFSIVHLTFD
jgi:sigma-B regulation protein RsbU (phosphoserine phosphatase)